MTWTWVSEDGEEILSFGTLMSWNRTPLYVYRLQSAGGDRGAPASVLRSVRPRCGFQRSFILKIPERKCVSWRSGLEEPRAARRAATFRAETWREPRPDPAVHRVIPRRLAFSPTPALVARCWTKLEFSSRLINTMWPCWDSDWWSTLLIQGRGTWEWGNFSQSMVGKLQTFL